MDTEQKNVLEENGAKKESAPKENFTLQWAIIIAFVIIIGALVSRFEPVQSADAPRVLQETRQAALLKLAVLPAEGAVLPVKTRELGARLVSVGVIDEEKFISLYEQDRRLAETARTLLFSDNTKNLVITPENAGVLLNFFWALGLGTKNAILEEGPMADPRYGGAGNFASTGGWTIAKGGAMEHYSMHPFVVLTPEQQELVERVAKNIYRPCCGNSTYFPDCNHGMAMLGLLELMASQGVSEEEMYKAALAVNSYWFPDTYLAIAQYFENRGVSWGKVSAKEVLGSAYSSAQGYQQIRAQIEPIQRQGSGGGCSV